MSVAEMVIKLVDGSENQPSPNYLPDGSQNVPTVDSVTPKSPFPAPSPSQAPEPKEPTIDVTPNYPNYLTNSVFIDSMDEFTRRIEAAIEAARVKRNPVHEPSERHSPREINEGSSEAVFALNTAVDALKRFSPKWLEGALGDLQKALAANGNAEQEVKRQSEQSTTPPSNSVPTVASVSDALVQISSMIADRVEETNRHLQSIVDSIENKNSPSVGGSLSHPSEAPQTISPPPHVTQPGSAQQNFVARFTGGIARRLSKTRVGRLSQSVSRKATPVVRSVVGRAKSLSRRSAPRASNVSSSSVRRAAGSFLSRAGGTAATGASAATGRTVAGAGSAATTAAASGAGSVMAVGAAIALPVAALAALTAAAYGTKQAFDAAADTIEKFSPGVNYQRARSRANTEINMLERSRVIGGTATQIESAKTHLQDSMERIWTRILSLLETLSPLVTGGVNSLSLLVDIASTGIASLDVLKSRMTLTDRDDDKEADSALKTAKERMNVSWDRLFRGTQQKATPPTFDDMFERFRKSVEDDKR